MKNTTRRDVCIGAISMAGLALQATAQVHATESPVTRGTPAPPDDRGTSTPPAPPATGPLTTSRAIPFDRMPIRTMANGGESRDILHGTLATGETVNLHQSMQPAGVPPNPAHVIQHSEFIFVREGELAFDHEAAGQVVTERVGPGGVIYVAFGTRHTVKNVGAIPARYFVVAIGGDAK